MFLVQAKGLPNELENLIFDLWALRVAQLADRIASAYQESDSQSQVFSTLESEESETTDNERGIFSAPRDRDKKLQGAPNLYDCLVLCYLGISTLRLPITPGDIYAWTTDGDMAFRGAIKLLPLAMRDRLPASYHAVLDPQTLMRHKRFYSTMTNLQISFEKDHGILWPVLNVPLLLYRYLKDLALPLELYDSTLRLGDLLGYDFAFHYDGRRQLGIRHLPEAQLIGCLIVCIKLFYPFDKYRRFPESSSEPSATVVDWKKWCEQMRNAKLEQRQSTPGLTTEELTELQESDVFEMGSDQLDQYLDFYADSFLDNAEIQRTKDSDDFRNALYGMFPIEGKEHSLPVKLSEGLSHERSMETVRAVHSDMKTRPVVGEDQDALRPGQMYPIWKGVQNLPKRAAIFYEEAARLSGLSMEMLAMAVFLTEARIEKWRRKQYEGSRGRGG
jgi:RNA polymerase I-specific transcription initiation factor RRN7